jgi:hypothetical protein
MVAGQHCEHSSPYISNEWLPAADGLTRAGAHRHHRDDSVRNSITYLCIDPGLHNCTKDARYGSEGLVLRWNAGRCLRSATKVPPCENAMEWLTTSPIPNTMIAAVDAHYRTPPMLGVVNLPTMAPMFPPRVIPSRPCSISKVRGIHVPGGSRSPYQF